MIRDLSQSDKIKYSKKFVDNSPRTFLFSWFIDPEGMFEDIDFYLKTSGRKFTLKAKISGIICGLLVFPFIVLTFLILFPIVHLTKNKDFHNAPYSIQAFTRGIIYLFFILPYSLIKFPFSLYSYFTLKKKALFYLLEVDNDPDVE